MRHGTTEEAISDCDYDRREQKGTLLGGVNFGRVDVDLEELAPEQVAEGGANHGHGVEDSCGKSEGRASLVEFDCQPFFFVFRLVFSVTLSFKPLF